jgi:predicted ATPase
MARVVAGDYAVGYRQLGACNNIWRGIGGLLNVPFNNTMMARALVGLGRFDEAKPLLDEALEIIANTDHRMHEAEAHRVLAELYQRQSNPNFDAAQNSFHKAIDVARSQEAKGYELRATTSLASLWQGRGKRREAREVLAPIYAWFTEGFDTKDLKEAKALLDELS